MRIIAICGPKGSGKDTAAKILWTANSAAEHDYFRHAPIARGVKNVCADFFGWSDGEMDDMNFKETPRELWVGGPVMEPRFPMMDIANFLRDHYRGDIHIQRWLRHARNYEDTITPLVCHVATDMRFPEELEAFLEQDALIIYIARKTAEEALEAKQAAGDKMALNPSEAFYDLLKNHPKTLVIPNDKEIYHLHNEILTAVKNKFGHPIIWEMQ